jgi:hypothetical protein
VVFIFKSHSPSSSPHKTFLIILLPILPTVELLLYVHHINFHSMPECEMFDQTKARLNNTLIFFYKFRNFSFQHNKKATTNVGE